MTNDVFLPHEIMYINNNTGHRPIKMGGGGRLGGQIARAILRYEMVTHLMLSTSMEGGGVGED